MRSRTLENRADSPLGEKCSDEGRWPGLAEGDPEAYQAVYAAFLPFVTTMLRAGFNYKTKDGRRHFARVYSTFDAEELTQDVFAQFFAQCEAKKFDASRPVKPYLRRIAVNLVLRHLARRGREVPTDFLEVEAEPVDRIEDAERARLVGEFKDGLNDTDKALLSGFFEGQALSQAALGESLGMSRDQVYRALVKLRKRAVAFFSNRGWGREP